MFVHPHCPCSRASLAELNLLATECRDRFALRIVFVRPEGLPQGSEDSSLSSAAEARRKFARLAARSSSRKLAPPIGLSP